MKPNLRITCYFQDTYFVFEYKLSFFAIKCNLVLYLILVSPIGFR